MKRKFKASVLPKDNDKNLLAAYRYATLQLVLCSNRGTLCAEVVISKYKSLKDL